MSFEHIAAGDIVTRMLAGVCPMQLYVSQTDECFIYCGEPGVGWKFRRDNGAEVDEELGWDGRSHTGSYLISYAENE